MYILKNAIKNITRTKSRNILIGIIIVVISIASCVALSIKNSSEKLIESYKSSNEIEAEITLNRENLKGNARNSKQQNNTSISEFMNNVQRLNVDDINKYGQSEYVKDYYYTIETELNSSNLSKATIEDENEPPDLKMPNMNNMKGGNGTQNNKVLGDFKVIGYSSLNAMEEFEEGTYKIEEGSIFDINSDEKQCVISQDLADENSVKVGDNIILVNPNNEAFTYEFKVVGIYSDFSKIEEFTIFSNSANQILTSYNALNDIYSKSLENSETNLNLETNAKFILNNEDVIESFKSELTSKGLSSNYTVTTNLETLENNLKPIKNLSTFVTTFLIIVLIIGAIVLVVIGMINIRERKYEIGVLRSIGMKRYKVLLQFIIELTIVSFVSIIVGTIIGSLLTVPISNALLKSEIESAKTSQTQVNNNFGMEMPNKMEKGDIRNNFAIESTNYVDKLNAVIDIKTILELIGIGVVLTLVSSSISMIFISRYSPLKILNSRT